MRNREEQSESIMFFELPEGGPSWEQPDQFIKSDITNSFYSRARKRSIRVIPYVRWERISDFARENLGKIDNRAIDALIKMPIEMLDTVLAFVKKHQIIDSKVIDALSTIKAAEFDDFTAFIQKNNILSQAALLHILVKAPKKIWLSLTNFMRSKNFDEIIMSGGLLYTKYPEEQWDKLSRGVQKIIRTSIIEKLIKKPPEQTLAFINFIIKQDVSNIDAIDVFVDIPEEKAKRLWIFAEKNGFINSVPTLMKITDAQWKDVTNFILKHLDQLEEGRVNCSFTDALAEVKPEAWPKLMKLIKTHKIKDCRLIESLLSMSVDMWENAIIFVKEYNASSYDLQSFRQFPSKQWPQFISSIKNYHISDSRIISQIARVDPELQKWDQILAIPFFQDPRLSVRYRELVIGAIYSITDYGDERAGRIENALAVIRREDIPQNGNAYGQRLLEILSTPLCELYDMRRAAAAGAVAINVHANGRDDATLIAMTLFMALEYKKDNSQNDYHEFIDYLNKFPDQHIKKYAQVVIGLQPAQELGFPPLRADDLITAYNLNISGQEFFARLWHFINHSPFVGLIETDILEKERENARIALIKSLADAYEDQRIVCEQGKIQRITVGVLQGRLENVQVDKEISMSHLTYKDEEKIIGNAVTASLQDFLKTYDAVKTKKELQEKLEKWLKKEHWLPENLLARYRKKFQADLDYYLKYSDLPEKSPSQMKPIQFRSSTNYVFFFKCLSSLSMVGGMALLVIGLASANLLLLGIGAGVLGLGGLGVYYFFRKNNLDNCKPNLSMRQDYEPSINLTI